MGVYSTTVKAKKSTYDKDRYQSNQKAILERVRVYQETHKAARRKYEKKILPRILLQRRQRYHSDLNFKLACNLRARIWSALRGRTKSARTMDLIGCTIDELRKRIEDEFTRDMNWKKVMSGDIHIDHIRQCVTFDLSDPAQQRECFNYANLRPLWWEDNLKRPKWKVERIKAIKRIRENLDSVRTDGSRKTAK